MLLLALCAGIVLALGVRSYDLLLRSPAQSAPEMKYQAEGVFFYSLLGTAALLAGFAWLLLRSRRVYRELDRIIALARSGNAAWQESLARVGGLGSKIRLLCSEMSTLNDQRLLRISSLSAVNAFLLANSELRLAVLDITGRVKGASRKLQEKCAAEMNEIVGRHISDLLESAKFDDVVVTLEREPGLLQIKDAETLTFVPLRNRQGALSDIICVWGQKELVSAFAAPTPAKGEGERRGLSGFLRNTLGARRRRTRG
jgi:hypothetical protein